MKHFLNTRTLMLIIFLLLGALPASAALEGNRPIALRGNGSMAFITDQGGNVIGGNVTASGTATHLGLWTQVGTLNFTPDANDPNLILASGTATFTAANGDKLEVLAEDGVLNVSTGIATGVFRFVGGTGRFEQASGSASFVVEQNLVTGAFEVIALGALDF